MNFSLTNKVSAVAIGTIAIAVCGAGYALAANNTNFTQTITGVLNIDIVDESGNSVATPSVTFGSVPFSMSDQSTAGTLGTASERIRVTNPRTTASWSAVIAATGGAAATWTSATSSYDYNDSSANATDGGDADTVGGQMTIDPAAGTIAGVAATTTTNVSLGSSTAFEEGTVDSITLMSASAGAQAPGQWDLSGVNLNQTIPAAQAAESYSLDMTLTVS